MLDEGNQHCCTRLHDLICVHWHKRGEWKWWESHHESLKESGMLGILMKIMLLLVVVIRQDYPSNMRFKMILNIQSWKKKLNWNVSLKGAQHLAKIHPEVVRTSIFALAIPYVLFLHMDDLTRGLNLRAISRLMTELGQTNPYGKSIQGDPSPTNSDVF